MLSEKEDGAIDNSEKEAIHQYRGGIVRLTVDVCNSPAGAAFLFCVAAAALAARSR